MGLGTYVKSWETLGPLASSKIMDCLHNLYKEIIVQRWFVGFNDYWFTASIHLEETPMGLCFLEWLVGWICHSIPAIKLPKIRFRLKDKNEWDWAESNDGWTDLREWYGDLSQLWHIFVCVPVNNLAWKRTETKVIDLPFNFAREKFPNSYTDSSYCSNSSKDLVEEEKHRKVADQLEKEFKEVYDKLNYEYLKKEKEELNYE